MQDAAVSGADEAVEQHMEEEREEERHTEEEKEEVKERSGRKNDEQEEEDELEEEAEAEEETKQEEEEEEEEDMKSKTGTDKRAAAEEDLTIAELKGILQAVKAHKYARYGNERCVSPLCVFCFNAFANGL